MPRFTANVSILFSEHAFLDRFAAARDAGFTAVECWFPDEHGPQEIRQRLDDYGLTMVGINTSRGTDDEFGLAAVPGREAAFRTAMDRALDHAALFGNCAIHVMAGTVGAAGQDAAMHIFRDNLTTALRLAEGTGIQLLIEPLNSHDRPGYALSTVAQAAEIIDSAGLHALRIMFDCYHVAMEGGDVIAQMHAVWPKIGHIQFAGVPARGVPSEGRVDYTTVFAEIDRLGWPGWVGAEYRADVSTPENLAWLGRFGTVSR